MIVSKLRDLVAEAQAEWLANEKVRTLAELLANGVLGEWEVPALLSDLEPIATKLKQALVEVSK